MLRTFTIVLLSAGGIFAALPQDTSKPKPQPVTSGRQDKADQDSLKQASKIGDSYFAKWASTTQSNLIELSRIAQQRATDPEVKRFATMMVEDHQACVQKLVPFTSGSGRPGASGSVPPVNGSSNGNGKPDQAPAATRTNASGELDHAALFDELGQQCLLTARNELASKQGAEFDRCYTMMMVASHSMSGDMLVVFQRHVTPELAVVLADAQTKTSAHLATAKDLAQRLERKDIPARKAE
ncbi:MAG: DUF4142 domain-containing protein [Planctomycetota bacterium]|nr:DUF4142 domain-containing protein [Planctomycetota bacterium]